MNDTDVTPEEQFVKEYNLLFNVPDTRATVNICEEYKAQHKNEFTSCDWSIDKHRKRFMDWMSKQSALKK